MKTCCLKFAIHFVHFKLQFFWFFGNRMFLSRALHLYLLWKLLEKGSICSQFENFFFWGELWVYVLIPKNLKKLGYLSNGPQMCLFEPPSKKLETPLAFIVGKEMEVPWSTNVCFELVTLVHFGLIAFLQFPFLSIFFHR